ncbi:hypothetical protein [Rhodoflexus caldus]|uniref:hypothetical protein n=1 Tax=Rhodoflexus caldus TaxID=2891236 RepID=UPI00202A8278|nr:hypothetical protein [Rhodoflexus caldus]
MIRKSAIQLASALNAKLIEFPKIVTGLEQKDIDFLNVFLSWIKSCEEILAAHNISSVAELAGLRGKIIAAKFSDNNSTTSAKKIQQKVAAECLFDAQKIVLETLKPLEFKLNECRELLRQLLLIIAQTNAVKYEDHLPFAAFLDNIWQFIISNEQLKPGAVKLKTLLTASDIQLLMAEEINMEDFTS